MHICRFISIIFFIFFATKPHCQVTIGSNTPPQPYAILEVVSGNGSLGGLRIPQVMDDTERQKIEDLFTINNQLAKGLLIFNITENALQYWDGISWITLKGGNESIGEGKPVFGKNGISLVNGVADTLLLGGSLTQNTSIDTKGLDFKFTGGDISVNGVTIGRSKGDVDTANTAIGKNTLFANTTGKLNTAVGRNALYRNTAGGSNTSLGSYSAENITTGNYNTAIGAETMQRIAGTVTGNTAVGYQALQGADASTNTGNYNSALGYRALGAKTTGGYNVAMGGITLQNLTTGNYNVGMGYNSLAKLTTPSGNVAVGYNSLSGLTTSGSYNVALGYSAGSTLTSGNYNIFIGYSVTPPSTTGSNQINIGNAIYGVSSTTVSGGRVAIGTTVPAASAILDLTSTNKGLLLPRVALSSTTNSTSPISSPSKGLLVYNTANAGSGSTAVVAEIPYIWTGTKWARLIDNPATPDPVTISGFQLKIPPHSGTITNHSTTIYDSGSWWLISKTYSTSKVTSTYIKTASVQLVYEYQGTPLSVSDIYPVLTPGNDQSYPDLFVANVVSLKNNGTGGKTRLTVSVSRVDLIGTEDASHMAEWGGTFLLNVLLAKKGN